MLFKSEYELYDFIIGKISPRHSCLAFMSKRTLGSYHKFCQTFFQHLIIHFFLNILDKFLTQNMHDNNGTIWMKLTTLYQRFQFSLITIVLVHFCYHKDTEPLYHSFMYSIVTLLSGIYPSQQCRSLLVTIIGYFVHDSNHHCNEGQKQQYSNHEL